jgi:hypothetical protein
MTFNQELCEDFFHRKAGVGNRAFLRRIAQPKRLPKAFTQEALLAIKPLIKSRLQII